MTLIRAPIQTNVMVMETVLAIHIHVALEHVNQHRHAMALVAALLLISQLVLVVMMTIYVPKQIFVMAKDFA